MVVLAVTWMAKTEREAEVAALLAKLTEESRKEPGCVTYQAHRHKTDPKRFFIYEQYKDDTALEAVAPPISCNTPGRSLPKIADRVEGNLLNRWGRYLGFEENHGSKLLRKRVTMDVYILNPEARTTSQMGELPARMNRRICRIYSRTIPDFFLGNKLIP